MKQNIGVLLAELSNFGLFEPVIFKKHILEQCKSKRKELGTEIAKEKGYNIFDKRNVVFDDVLGMAMSEGYIKSEQQKYRTELVVTEKGMEYLHKYLTNDFSPEYLQYQKSVDQMFQNEQQLELETLQIMRIFKNNYTEDDIRALYLKDSFIQYTTEKYHQYLLQKSGYLVNNEVYIFHLLPKIFVPVELMSSQVTLEVKGVTMPDNLIITQPFPNKRYFVAGQRFEKEKTVAGFYPFVSKTPPEKLEITLIWRIDGRKTVQHFLTLRFNVKEHVGRVFSTKQNFNRNNNLDKFDSTTWIDERSLSFKQSEDYDIEIKDNIIKIREEKSLTNFPMGLHCCFFGDKYYQQWEDANIDVLSYYK